MPRTNVDQSKQGFSMWMLISIVFTMLVSIHIEKAMRENHTSTESSITKTLGYSLILCKILYTISFCNLYTSYATSYLCPFIFSVDKHEYNGEMSPYWWWLQSTTPIYIYIYLFSHSYKSGVPIFKSEIYSTLKMRLLSIN